MGNRLVIIAHDGREFADAALYHHSGGGKLARTILEGLHKVPTNILGDLSYLQGTLFGLAWQALGNDFERDAIGTLPAPESLGPSDLSASSHGDAGLFVVHLDRGEVTVWGGYGFGGHREDGEVVMRFEVAR